MVGAWVGMEWGRCLGGDGMMVMECQGAWVGMEWMHVCLGQQKSSRYECMRSNGHMRSRNERMRSRNVQNPSFLLVMPGRCLGGNEMDARLSGSTEIIKHIRVHEIPGIGT